MGIVRIINSVKGIRRPISLAALGIIILYLIFKAVLSLSIFQNINENQTFLIVNGIVSYVFYLAILLLVLVFTERILKHILSTLDSSKKKFTKIEYKESKSIEEFVFINDRIHYEVSSCQNISLTFGETRRILTVIMKLKKLSEEHFEHIKERFNKDILQLIDNWYTYLNRFISEANAVFPFPKDDKYSLSTEYLKKDRYNVLTGWDRIKNLLNENSLVDGKKLKEIENDQVKKWLLQGFENEKEYQEFISPTIDSLVKTNDKIEIELIKEIAKRKIFSERELIDFGFERGIIVEVTNILMRSKLVTPDWDSRKFTLGFAGQKILNDNFPN